MLSPPSLTFHTPGLGILVQAWHLSHSRLVFLLPVLASGCVFRTSSRGQWHRKKGTLPVPLKSHCPP